MWIFVLIYRPWTARYLRWLLRRAAKGDIKAFETLLKRSNSRDRFCSCYACWALGQLSTLEHGRDEIQEHLSVKMDDNDPFVRHAAKNARRNLIERCIWGW